MTNNPLSLDRVIADPVLRKHFEAELAKLSGTDGPEGGIKIQAVRDKTNRKRPRALVYWGRLPETTQVVLRSLLGDEWTLSQLRSLEQPYRTATDDDPFRY
jgi:hypothetical protein